MNEIYQLQPLNERLNEVFRQLSREITDAVALERQNEYDKRSWEYLLRYLDERLQRCQPLFTSAATTITSQRNSILNTGVRPQKNASSKPPRPRATGPQPHPDSFRQFSHADSNKPIQGSQSDTNGPRSEAVEHRALGYETILAAAKCINDSDSGSLTLQDLANCISGENLLSDEHSNLRIQVAFHIVGWLTGVWNPVWDGSLTRSALQIKSSRIPGKRRFDWTDCQAVRETQKPIEELQASPISYIMGGAFGQLLPRPERVLQRQEVPETESEAIPKAYFSWEAMSQSDYQVMWTSTLNEHLQTDKRHKIVFIYQHPSLCWLLYNRKGANLLTRLFSEEQEQRNVQEGRYYDGGFGIDDFFDDLLRSYQLIFASDSVPLLLNSRRPGLTLPQEDCDPLLRSLCSANRDNALVAALRDELEIPPANGPYVDLDEFPFLGKRLGVLARIGKGNDNPHNLWKLWVEKFNPNGYTYRWIIIFLALGAFIFQIVQTIASILQVIPGRS